MDSLRQDTRYALRSLLRSPGFTLVAVLTLALGIGANTAIFSVVDGVLLRELPYEESDELYSIYHVDPTGRVSPFMVPTIIAWRERQRAWDGLATTSYLTTMNLTGTGTPEHVGVKMVSANLFELLGVDAALGRVFEPGEDERGAEPVAILGHGFWERRFGADPGVLGDTVELNGTLHTVVGVTPPDFPFTFPRSQAPDLLVPRVFTEDDEQNWGYFRENTIGRLAEGVTVEQARDEGRRLQRELLEENSEQSERAIPQGVEIVPLQEKLVGDVGRTLWLLFGAVGVVLLVACANVTNLVMARNAERDREVAVRVALGAGRARLMGQALAEMALIAGAGGAVGFLLAWWLTGAFLAMAPETTPRLGQVTLDLRVLAFTGAVSLGIGLLFGVVPALRSSATPPASALRGRSRGSSRAASHHRLLGALVSAESALVLVLLVGAGLLLRSFQELRAVDPGFDTSGRLAVQMTLSDTRYTDSDSIAELFDRLLGEIRRIPAVEAAGGVWAQPLSGSRRIRLPAPRAEGSDADPEEMQEIEFDAVTPGFFDAAGIPLIAGRDFTASDHLGEVDVAIVSESFADYYWPHDGVVGRRYSHDQGATWIEVVGVVADTTNQGLPSPSMPTVYWPQRRVPFPWTSMDVVIDTRLDDPASLVPVVREAIWRVDPEQPIGSIRSFDAMVAVSIREERFELALFGAFGALALVLGTVGIYGVASYSVNQRVREIGMRMALGADAAGVVRSVLGRGLVPVLLGVGAGIVLAAALGRLISSLLFAVSPFDPVTLVAVPALLVAVAALAILRPARRAAAVDPLEAMRAD